MDKPKYCCDTNFIFDLYKENKGRYPKDILPGLWAYFNSLLDKGLIISVIDVYQELMKEEKEEQSFKDWLKSRKNVFLEIDELAEKEIRTIIDKYPVFAAGFKGSAADPVIIGYAKAYNLTVLTTENNPGHPSPNMPKLPSLCLEVGVKCMGVWDFCRGEKLQFNIQA